jgi:hypothetical protein
MKETPIFTSQESRTSLMIHLHELKDKFSTTSLSIIKTETTNVGESVEK